MNEIEVYWVDQPGRPGSSTPCSSSEALIGGTVTSVGVMLAPRVSGRLMDP